MIKASKAISKMRPIQYAFDPAGTTPPALQKLKHFSFLSDSLSHPTLGLHNTEAINPSAVRVPWPTYFPACVQCKYWPEAKRAAQAILHQIMDASPEHQGMIPSRIHKEMISGSAMTKSQELVETSFTAPINMFPAASKTRAEIMAKANVLIFMHDDVIESHLANEGTTIIDDALVNLQSENVPIEKVEWKNNIFGQFAREALEEDPVTGPEYVYSVLQWADYTRNNSATHSLRFSTFGDYLGFRIRDFAVEFIVASLKFTCEAPLSETEIEPLKSAGNLYIAHFALTNDLYSYDKEARESAEHGSAVVNGVQVLQDLLCVSPSTAKILLRTLLLDIEKRLYDEYEALVINKELNDNQLRYARGMIESLAGNIFYSATCFRYARVIPGALLDLSA
ncbi:hypothetical protein ASPWEDRAFT_166682 [Aspergillus wentii DTO 134E9]|uniref:Terpene synthase n=1 Tax=Aspergillus wentii DTO 134E9 TaxID=1073089 RepID=A0A1L9S0B7_ASPWE|nr:uncharacterized protein ASPWEDRAFT_166682 [Aspergillus wentii DTO 134E9]KAI9933032.1 hypothetical protein MW887_009286 [Aspergillus wentii]OJJ40615.1 hypothetical protein ASPWEDRAFT_166682 [Aspergillus wentii DTO 134E9]